MSYHKMPPNMIDLTGQKFGKLTVLKRAGQTKNGNALWLCQCDCGNTTVAMGTSLRRGDTISCGCLTPDRITNARQVLLTDKSVDGVPVPLLTKKVRSDSGTGIKGVHQRIRKGHTYYEASITVNGKRKYVGTFKDINQAIRARKEAEKKYYQPYIDALKNKENKK
ncbi:AP2 domain-containing protein [Sporolactobacillus sp. CQH2019]|uniref:AP2 domain-containing protein n=1 Tax=Sporolactobacillus sp. CQH2019 TaxID=3023512 RepID=UPI00236841B3|nr:AP2 domain-containing protein [Sporolactobacillus sp. CQH2019]MDD9147809.1 AP2 domain-containing protein [Sporolactobacillus sp. CQH2019]